ncbi:MAG: isochorismatase [Gammaproteobacteria bacterium RIFCSPHIGHO2_12_FULL_43_28]|nr:MAG: isochorismatase [Gammaproteobacteria bacterium RIFCSPHIGHO2_12_FULL_43_28]
MNTALLLLEIQNDYFPNGRVPLEKSQEASAKAKDILTAYRKNKWPIIHVQHISTQPNAAYLLPCTKGAEFHESVQPVKGEMIIKKHYPNSFKDTALLNHLIKNKINQLIVCGMMTHLTIDATVRAAYDLGFSLTVVQDACAAKQLEFNNTSINAQTVQSAFLAALQPVYADVLTADEILQKAGLRTSPTSTPIFS